MLTLRVRMADPSDKPTLVEIAYEAWELSILSLMAERSGQRASERARLEAVVSETLARIIVAEWNGEVVGWCSRARKRAYIPYLFVAPDCQGRGIGTVLLNRMESILELHGASRVVLETYADHLLAVRFYEKQGYRILAIRPSGRSEAAAFTSIHFEKQLRPYKGDIGDD